MNPRLLRPLASGFSPRQVADLALWLDASDASTITLNGSTVSEWQDKSGNGKHAGQATAVDQPTYTANVVNGRSAVVFDGSSDHLSGSAVFSALPCSLFVACLFPSLKNIGMMFEQFTGTTDNLAFYRGHSATDGFRLFNGVNLSSAALPANNAWHIMGFEAGTTAANSRLFYNGSIDQTGNAGTQTPQQGGYYLARWAGAGASPAYTPVTIGEVLAYKRSLTVAEAVAVQRYLGKRWGVTI